MQIHGLFPTLLLEEKNENSDHLKKIFLETILNYTDQDGYSSEGTGHVTLHHEPLYEPIFAMATKLAKQYCEVMQIDPELFDFNITKTWFNIIEKQETPFHNHGDSHLSFCYYVNVPHELASPIRFYAHFEKYEPVPGFAKFNNPAEWNLFNSYCWSFPASEGTMYLWPAKVSHDTPGVVGYCPPGIKTIEDAKQRRISLAGDILLTYKEKAKVALGLQPKRNWRTFTTNLLP